MQAGPDAASAVPVVTGYLHQAYAAALSHVGTPRWLQASGTWILERAVTGSPHRDAMGCYPLLCCRNWAGLARDLDQLEADSGLAAFSAVLDPFCDLDTATLSTCFPNLAVPFKEHYIVDLQVPIETVLDPHHRRNERKGLANVTVEMVTQAETCDADFVGLYRVLGAKHGIRGWAAFPDESLRQQLRVPGMVAFRATKADITLGMTIWYVQDQTAYYHLGAYTDDGYNARASYAVFSVAIRHFAAAGLRWLDLGAAAGLKEDQSNGLARFKRGWSTGTRPAYLCGRILNREAYAALTIAAGKTAASYFPAYRHGEFG